MFRLLALAIAAVAIPITMGAAIALGANGPLTGELQNVRAALAHYHSVTHAERDGYVPGSPCEQSPDGAMGIHYVNPALMGPGVDPLRPEVLLYVPDKRGNLKLVGIEYWQADADQDLGTDEDRPAVFGQPFDGPMPGHAPGMPIHYDLHVWLYEQNPLGVFAAWNPGITCPTAE
jgi:hypothetical protein